MENDNKNTMKTSDWIKLVLGIALIIFGVFSFFSIVSNNGYSFFGKSNSSATTNNSSHFKYLETAVKHLQSDNIVNAPIQEILVSGNKVIYYDNDILVQLSYKIVNLTSSAGSFYDATFSINENAFISRTRLDNMMYTDEWKNAKVETIKMDTVTQINEKYFK